MLYKKFNATRQRRHLRPNEIENAITKAYNGSSKAIKYIGNGLSGFVAPEFVKTSGDSYWNKSIPLPKDKSSSLAIRRATKATPWSLHEVIEDTSKVFRFQACRDNQHALRA